MTDSGNIPRLEGGLDVCHLQRYLCLLRAVINTRIRDAMQPNRTIKTVMPRVFTTGEMLPHENTKSEIGSTASALLLLLGELCWRP